jgi:hypothetical protein
MELYNNLSGAPILVEYTGAATTNAGDGDTEGEEVAIVGDGDDINGFCDARNGGVSIMGSSSGNSIIRMGTGARFAVLPLAPPVVVGRSGGVVVDGIGDEVTDNNGEGDGDVPLRGGVADVLVAAAAALCAIAHESHTRTYFVHHGIV